MRKRFGTTVIIVIALAALSVVGVGSASAKSRLFVTGFDPDYHCSLPPVKRAPQKRGTVNPACDFFAHAVPFVRNGAPHPGKPVLVLDHATKDQMTGGLELEKSLKAEFGSGFPTKVMNPRGARFRDARITTKRYSAMLVASDYLCEGCDLNGPLTTRDSDAIAARRQAIRGFFKRGGGILALSAGESGDQDRCNAYYAFSPIHIPCPATNGSGSSTTTPAGQALGFSDANFGSAHNTYGNPGPSSPLKVAARQTALPNAPTALFAKVRFPHH
jgi:hypothetical protein